MVSVAYKKKITHEISHGRVCVCVRACMRPCVRACVRACVCENSCHLHLYIL